jgi:hypothetical protein
VLPEQTVTRSAALDASDPSPLVRPQVCDEEYVDYLKLEVEHYYRAELHCEQRASWVLTISFGALALTVNSFIGITEGKVNATAAPALYMCMALFLCATVSALITVWPIRGRRGALCYPFSGLGAMNLPGRNANLVDLWCSEYSAHRMRSRIKTRRMVWTIVYLSGGIVVGSFALLKNGGAL